MNLRSGVFGKYYGSFFNESHYLPEEMQEVNAKYIYQFLTSKGWSVNAICGVLGNMEAESTLNPGCWESHNVGNLKDGYGLVQWTPATNYINWCVGDASEMDNNLNRIIYELENNLQWIATANYPFSFKEFSTSTEAPDFLAIAFLKNYERAGVEVEEKRKANALKWYTYLEGVPIEPSDPSANIRKKRNKYKFFLFKKAI